MKPRSTNVQDSASAHANTAALVFVDYRLDINAYVRMNGLEINVRCSAIHAVSVIDASTRYADEK